MKYTKSPTEPSKHNQRIHRLQTKKSAVVSHSFGKDSTLALHKAISAGFQVEALLVSVNQEHKRSWFHGLSSELMQRIAQSLSIPLYPIASCGQDYAERFVEALTYWRSLGVTTAVYGDIDIEEHREWCRDISNQAGLKALHPLWAGRRRELVLECLDLGYKPIIKSVSKKHGVPKDFLGRSLDRELVAELESLSIDPCGESGEFHTVVLDGPLYLEPILWEPQGIHESEYGYSLIM